MEDIRALVPCDDRLSVTENLTHFQGSALKSQHRSPMRLREAHAGSVAKCKATCPAPFPSVQLDIFLEHLDCVHTYTN